MGRWCSCSSRLQKPWSTNVPRPTPRPGPMSGRPSLSTDEREAASSHSRPTASPLSSRLLSSPAFIVSYHAVPSWPLARMRGLGNRRAAVTRTRPRRPGACGGWWMAGERRAIGSHKSANHVFALYLTVDLEARGARDPAKCASHCGSLRPSLGAVTQPPLLPLSSRGWRVPSAEKG